MLEKVGFELTIPGPAQTRQHRQRAQLILDLLTPSASEPLST
jgi:hypothetical protein